MVHLQLVLVSFSFDLLIFCNLFDKGDAYTKPAEPKKPEPVAAPGNILVYIHFVRNFLIL